MDNALALTVDLIAEAREIPKHRSWVLTPSREYLTWESFDNILSKRQGISWLNADALESKVLGVFKKLTVDNIGWGTPEFFPDDHIGALLWDPADCLAGAQVLIDLERYFNLPAGFINGDVWHRRTLRDFLEFIATTLRE